MPDPGAPIISNPGTFVPPTYGTPSGTPYARAVALTPGTPVPAGRGAIVTGAGPVLLKLSGGGTIKVSDNSAGGGTRFDGYAVVDADVSQAPGATVTVLY